MNRKQYYPRVLVLSHSAFSETSSNGKTLASFFENWPKDQIAQFYITNELPNSTACKYFFRITDLEILFSFIKPHAYNKSHYSIGKSFSIYNKPSSDQISIRKNTNILSNFITYFIKNRISFAILIRDILWNSKRWESHNFLNWLDDFKPEVLFFHSSNCVFPYKIVNWIQKKYNIPLIMQITDDYLTPGFTLDPFNWIHQKWLKTNFLETLKKSYKIIAISEKMLSEYKVRFGGSYEVLMNSISIDSNLISYKFLPPSRNGFNLIYTGNLGLNRWKVLVILGQCLKELNEKGLKNTFQIYSNKAPNKSIETALNISEEIKYCGSLNKKELEEKLPKADLLVHVEAFNKKNRRATRLSISTKIPEYMATKKCIFAIGPKEIASIQYLLNNDIALVCTNLDKNEIKKTLLSLQDNTQLLTQIAENAFNMAISNHDIAKSQEKINEIIFKAFLSFNKNGMNCF